MSQIAISLLMVEDSADDAELILLALRRGGFEVDMTRVEDERGLRRCLAEHAWDLVLSDYAMPQFSGSEALRVVRDSGLDLPFILVSGYLGEDKAVAIMRAGANDFVSKESLARLVPVVQRELREAANRLERRAAQEAVAANERLLRAIAQSVGVGIVVIDKYGLCQFVNREAERLLGVTPLEVFGVAVDVLIHAGVQGTDAAEIDERTRAVLTGKAEAWSRDVMWRAQGGRTVPLWWSVTPLRQDTHITGVAVALRDVTERHERERALAETHEELRKLSQHLEGVQEAERAHLARELHDELGQMLLAIKLNAAWLRSHSAEAGEDTRQKIAALLGLVDETIGTVRRIAADLRPIVLNDLGLVAAVEWLVERFRSHSGIVCELQLPAGELDMPAESATVVYRMVQESLTNAARHAQAKRVSVSLSPVAGGVVAVVEDDGIGFAASQKARPGSFGLIGIRERAGSVGGSVQFGSGPMGGARVELFVPIGRRRAEEGL